MSIWFVPVDLERYQDPPLISQACFEHRGARWPRCGAGSRLLSKFSNKVSKAWRSIRIEPKSQLKPPNCVQQTQKNKFSIAISVVIEVQNPSFNTRLFLLEQSESASSWDVHVRESIMDFSACILLPKRLAARLLPLFWDLLDGHKQQALLYAHQQAWRSRAGEDCADCAWACLTARWYRWTEALALSILHMAW